MANNLTGAAKLEEVTKLINILSTDLETPNLLPEQRDAHLEQLKIYGRDPKNADPVFTKHGINVLARHALDSRSRSTSQNALRCLANAMLLKPETRQIFLSLEYESKVCNILKNDNRDDEFLASRIVFLTTYTPKVEIEKLLDQQDLASIVCTNLGRHAAQYNTQKKQEGQRDPMEEMALVESLKLLFNLTHFCPSRSGSFAPAIPHILNILLNRPIHPSKPLDSPISPLVNSLLNIPLNSEESTISLFSKSSLDTPLDRLFSILDKATQVYKDEDLDQLVSPLLTLLRRIYELAPQEVKKQFQSALLPSDEDRDQPLGKSASLPSRLLRLSSSVSAPQFRESSSSLLYELSNKDARVFVQNVGYGFASGFLFQHNIPVPENSIEGLSPAQDRSSNVKARMDSQTQRTGINPITGQFLEKEEKIEEVKMTDEEKEREAERLFVLFERLKKTGVINVENPVATAYQQGRFEELDDDAGSDSDKK